MFVMKYIQHSLLILFMLSNSFYLSAQSSLTKSVDSLLQPQFKPDEPGGVILIAKKGEVIYKKAFGMGNLELNVPVNDSMIFYIASNTKQFTAVAVLQLVEKGKLQLEDTLGKFISCPSPVGSITVRQLLSHTGGIVGNNDKPDFRLVNKTGMTPLDYVQYIVHQPVNFPAGTKWDYSNNSYQILGYMIEKLSGLSYSDYITKNIFNVAGMRNSYIQKESSVIKNRASGYIYSTTGFQNTFTHNSDALYAAGCMQSTAEDLLKWNQALKSGLLLKQQTLQLAYTPQPLKNGTPTTYGFGWHIWDLRGSATYRHGGALPGFTSETLYLPQEDVYIVMLLNEETPKVPLVALSRIIGGLAINKPYYFTEAPIDQKELKKFIGLYENGFGELVNIFMQDEQLHFQRPNGRRYKLHYSGNNEFFFEMDFLRVEFTSDAAGGIKSLKFSKVGIGLTEWMKTNRPLLKLPAERVSDSLLKQYVGIYVSSERDTLRVIPDGPFLHFQRGNGTKQSLAAENSAVFFSLNEDVRVEFGKDPATGALTLLLIKDNKRKKYIKSEPAR